MKGILLKISIFIISLSYNLHVLSKFEIIRLNQARWKEYKYLRLESLQKYPKSFRATYEEEAAYSDSQWRTWLQDAVTENGTLLLFAQKKENKSLIGMAGARPGKSSKTSHVATIFSVYVTPEWQGNGVATTLLQAILLEVKKRPMIVKLNLLVNVANEPAKKTYQRFGFESVALLNKELKINEKFEDFLLMEKFIDH